MRAPSKGISALKVIWNPVLAISTSLHGGLSLLESCFSDWDFGPSGASCPRKANAVAGHDSHKSQNQRLERTCRGDLHPSCLRTKDSCPGVCPVQFELLLYIFLNFVPIIVAQKYEIMEI